MNTNFFTIFTAVFLSLIGFIYIVILDTSYFPDYSKVFSNFINMGSNSLKLTLQYLILSKMSDYFVLNVDKESFSLFFFLT